MKLEYLIPNLIVIGLLSALAFAQQETTITVSTTVSPYLTVTPSYTAVDFGTVNAPSSNNVPVNLNQSAGEFNFTVSTNAPYQASAKVADIPSGLTEKIAISDDLAYVTNPVNARSLTTSYQVIFSKTVTAGGTYIDYNGHFLDVSSTAPAGAKTWSLYILYENI
jgi:hypothetical protein